MVSAKNVRSLKYQIMGQKGMDWQSVSASHRLKS